MTPEAEELEHLRADMIALVGAIEGARVHMARSEKTQTNHLDRVLDLQWRMIAVLERLLTALIASNVHRARSLTPNPP
jgi:hypothetical protein